MEINTYNQIDMFGRVILINVTGFILYFYTNFDKIGLFIIPLLLWAVLPLFKSELLNKKNKK